MAQIVLGPLTLGAEEIDAYLTATGSRSAAYRTLDVVPAPAVIALLLREFLSKEQLPPGTLQVSQHLEARRPVKVGEPLTCAADVSEAAYQAARRLVTLRFAILDSKGGTVLEGQTHLLVPTTEVGLG